MGRNSFRVGPIEPNRKHELKLWNDSDWSEFRRPRLLSRSSALLFVATDTAADNVETSIRNCYLLCCRYSTRVIFSWFTMIHTVITTITTLSGTTPETRGKMSPMIASLTLLVILLIPILSSARWSVVERRPTEIVPSSTCSAGCSRINAKRITR